MAHRLNIKHFDGKPGQAPSFAARESINLLWLTVAIQMVSEAALVATALKSPDGYIQLALLLFLMSAVILSATSLLCLWRGTPESGALDISRALSAHLEHWMRKAKLMGQMAWGLVAASVVLLLVSP